MRKLFSICVLIILIGLFSIQAEAVTTPPGKEEAAASTNTVVRPGEIRIPPEYGRIIERFDGAPDKLIVHIQDAHTNYEAQKNSAKILEDLINKYGLYLILVEGGSRDVSLDRYREEYTPEKRKEIAEESLKNGVIAGEEYLNIVSDYPMKLQGIEDRALYDQNMMTFLDIDKGKDEALLLIKAISSVVASLKPRIYNKALVELDEKRIGFKEEKVALNEYVQYLNDLAKTRSPRKSWFARIWEIILTFLSKLGLIKYTPPAKIDLSLYPSYQTLIDSIALEKEIDFAVVEKERADAIDVLSKKIGRDELNELLTRSIDFKSGRLTQAQYHDYLSQMLTKAKIYIKEYPNLERYTRYVVLYENINSSELFKELKSLAAVIEKTLITNEDQRRFLKIAKDLELLIEFINLKLAPDDFDYYLKNEGDFDIPAWIRFLNSQCIRFKLTQRLPEDSQAIDKVTPALKSFYTIARKRDEVFLNNAKKYMDAEDVNIAVLIAGGFHTPTLTNLLRENNISYIVVAPKVVKPTDEELYHKILTEGWTPAEGAEE